MSEIQDHLIPLLRDPSASVEGRIRRIASLGAIAGVLLGASAFEDLPDAELEAALRNLARDVLGAATSSSGRPGATPAP
jgi:hypothetical protein